MPLNSPPGPRFLRGSLCFLSILTAAGSRHDTLTRGPEREPAAHRLNPLKLCVKGNLSSCKLLLLGPSEWQKKQIVQGFDLIQTREDTAQDWAESCGWSRNLTATEQERGHQRQRPMRSTPEDPKDQSWEAENRESKPEVRLQGSWRVSLTQRLSMFLSVHLSPFYFLISVGVHIVRVVLTHSTVAQLSFRLRLSGECFAVSLTLLGTQWFWSLIYEVTRRNEVSEGDEFEPERLLHELVRKPLASEVPTSLDIDNPRLFQNSTDAASKIDPPSFCILIFSSFPLHNTLKFITSCV